MPCALSTVTLKQLLIAMKRWRILHQLAGVANVLWCSMFGTATINGAGMVNLPTRGFGVFR